MFSEQKEYYGRLTELFIMEIWPQDSFKGIRQMCKKNKGNQPNLTSGGCPPFGWKPDYFLLIQTYKIFVLFKAFW